MEDIPAVQTLESSDWLGLLRCPVCRGQLTDAPDAQAVLCRLHGEFPLRRDIPSFVAGQAFDAHWQDNHTERIPESKLAAARQFLAPVLDKLAQSEPLLILDDGCGDGVHAQVLSSHPNFSTGNRMIGLDISRVAVEMARSRQPRQSHFVHGDAMQLPFADDTFDCVFSFGVLAYTAHPFNAFRELCRVVKPGGLIGVWLYPKASGLSGILFSGVRALCRMGGPFITRRIADCIVPFLAVLPTRSGLSLRNATWRQCREVVLVNIQPTMLYFPDLADIEQWFADQGILVTHRDSTAPITLWGIKA